LLCAHRFLQFSALAPIYCIQNWRPSNFYLIVMLNSSSKLCFTGISSFIVCVLRQVLILFNYEYEYIFEDNWLHWNKNQYLYNWLVFFTFFNHCNTSKHLWKILKFWYSIPNLFQPLNNFWEDHFNHPMEWKGGLREGSMRGNPIQPFGRWC